MKKIITSVIQWASAAAVAVAMLPTSVQAILEPTNLYVDKPALYVTGQTINFTLEMAYDAENDKLNDDTIPEDFTLMFRLSDGSTREAVYMGPWENPEEGEYWLTFSYKVGPDDYSMGLFNVTGLQFGGTLRPIRNRGGVSMSAMMSRWDTQGEGGSILALEQHTSDNQLLRINPENAVRFGIYFLDEFGEKILPTQPAMLKEGQVAVQYVIDVGSTPTDPIEVIVNWGAENVFGEGSATTNYVTSAQQTFIIPVILDDGAVPAGANKHTYTIRALTDGRPEATAIATVENVAPTIKDFFGSEMFGTNNVLPVGQLVDVTVQIEDVAGQLDEISPDTPLDVTWKFGTQPPLSVETVWMGSYWESTAHGSIIKSGNTYVYVTVRDKDGGTVSTNSFFYAEQGDRKSVV